jgi:hypothetical protein
MISFDFCIYFWNIKDKKNKRNVKISTTFVFWCLNNIILKWKVIYGAKQHHAKFHEWDFIFSQVIVPSKIELYWIQPTPTTPFMVQICTWIDLCQHHRRQIEPISVLISIILFYFDLVNCGRHLQQKSEPTITVGRTSLTLTICGSAIPYRSEAEFC